MSLQQRTTMPTRPSPKGSRLDVQTTLQHPVRMDKPLRPRIHDLARAAMTRALLRACESYNPQFRRRAHPITPARQGQPPRLSHIGVVEGFHDRCHGLDACISGVRQVASGTSAPRSVRTPLTTPMRAWMRPAPDDSVICAFSDTPPRFPMFDMPAAPPPACVTRSIF